MISVLRILAAGLFLEGPASSMSTDLCLRNHMNPHAWRDLAGSKGQRLVTLESGGTWTCVWLLVYLESLHSAQGDTSVAFRSRCPCLAQALPATLLLLPEPRCHHQPCRGLRDWVLFIFQDSLLPGHEPLPGPHVHLLLVLRIGSHAHRRPHL